MTGKISVVIYTHNSDRMLDHVLRSVEPFDEVVVIDAESEDDTVKIATRPGVKVISGGDVPLHEHSEQPLREMAVKVTRHPWVLIIEPDEIVPPELAIFLKDFAKDPGEYRGVYIPRLNYVMCRLMKNRYPDYQLRIFHRLSLNPGLRVGEDAGVKGLIRKINASRRDLAIRHFSATIHKELRRSNVLSDIEAEAQNGPAPTYLQILFKPMLSFFGHYFFRSYWRRGTVGLIIAGTESFHTFLVLSKRHELYRRETYSPELDPLPELTPGGKGIRRKK